MSGDRLLKLEREIEIHRIEIGEIEWNMKQIYYVTQRNAKWEREIAVQREAIKVISVGLCSDMVQEIVNDVPEPIDCDTPEGSDLFILRAKETFLIKLLDHLVTIKLQLTEARATVAPGVAPDDDVDLTGIFD